MATKKHTPARSGKAVVKPAAKKTAKPGVSTPKKTSKVVKVAPAKKAASKRPEKKPVAKKAVKPSFKPTKPPVKNNTAKPGAKKPAQPISKQVTKNTNSVKKPVIAVNSAQRNMAKKEEVNKTAAIAPVKAAPSKQAAEIKAKDIKVPAAKPVVIPRMSTKTVRKYQPDFTKSVLDKTSRDPGAPTQRYSDSELIEFRELIQRKLEAAKKELSYLHGLITRKDEMGGDEGDNRYMTMEDGSLSMEREQLSQMASRQITFIDHLEKAVMRIENKTYGICRVTGKLIDKARLRAVPHATLSIEAKMGAR